MGQFGIGQSVSRLEDRPLLTGRGAFVDDLSPARLAHSVVVRAPFAHAHIRRIEIDAARKAPGVLAILTSADIAAAGLGAITCLAPPTPRPGTAFLERRQPLLVGDKVRMVGDAIAFVVAETVEEARDAAELVDVDYDPLPVAPDIDAALASDAPAIWAETPGNVAFEWEAGDAAAVERAFKAARDIVVLDLINNRVVLNAIETRGAVGQWDDDAGRYILHTGTQMPHPMKRQLAEDIFHIDADRVRVVVKDVGGGFGGKNSLFPEYALCLHAARLLGRPVKWICERSEGFVADFHGRDNISRGELAFDEQGRILGYRIRTDASLGAYCASRGPISPINGIIMTVGAYAIPCFHASVRCIYTNSAPTDPYRGAGRPEVTYLLERLIDKAADELGHDRIGLRRRNFIPRAAFPYRSPTGIVYDDGDFPKVLDRALDAAGWDDFEDRRRGARGGGRYRGIGLACYIERCGGGAGLAETAALSFDKDGTLSVRVGSMANGQGHETAFTQVACALLDLPPERVRVIEGDTDLVRTGTGTGGSWSIPMGGGAVARAAQKVLRRATIMAAEILEAAAEDIELDDGRFKVAGTDLAVDWDAIVAASFTAEKPPRGVAPGLAEQDRFEPENYTFPYGCHVAEVEVDPETGAVALLRYVAVHDFGRALNPAMLAGQVHGGLAQGIGQALMEHTVYDAEGQLLSGSFMDYRMPRADDLPAFEFLLEETPTTRNPLGAKGCGEAGATGSPPAVINALVDALKPFGIRHIDMPATPERVWTAIRRAGAADGPQ